MKSAPLNRVAQSVPAASCGSVPLPAKTPGGTPGELEGEAACATAQAGSWPQCASDSWRSRLSWNSSWERRHLAGMWLRPTRRLADKMPALSGHGRNALQNELGTLHEPTY